jgi:hypothetical protein
MSQSVTTKVAVKQLCYIHIMPRLKWLFLCEETGKQMRWHKEGIHDSEDADIMSYHADAEAWHALDHFDREFTGTPGVSVLIYRRMISNLTTLIVLRTLDDQFSWCHTIYLPTNVWRKILYSLLLWFRVLRSQKKTNEHIFVSVDGKAEWTVARGRCIWQLSEKSI